MHTIYLYPCGPKHVATFIHPVTGAEFHNQQATRAEALAAMVAHHAADLGITISTDYPPPTNPTPPLPGMDTPADPDADKSACPGFVPPTSEAVVALGYKLNIPHPVCAAYWNKLQSDNWIANGHPITNWQADFRDYLLNRGLDDVTQALTTAGPEQPESTYTIQFPGPPGTYHYTLHQNKVVRVLIAEMCVVWTRNAPPHIVCTCILPDNTDEMNFEACHLHPTKEALLASL